jgi:hypothetical protein
MTHPLFSILPSVHIRNCCFTDSWFNTLPKQILFTPLACWRGNSLNLLLFFLGLFIRTIWFFGVCSLFFMLVFIYFLLSRVSLILPSLSQFFPLISTTPLPFQESFQDISAFPLNTPQHLALLVLRDTFIWALYFGIVRYKFAALVLVTLLHCDSNRRQS